MTLLSDKKLPGLLLVKGKLSNDIFFETFTFSYLVLIGSFALRINFDDWYQCKHNKFTHTRKPKYFMGFSLILNVICLHPYTSHRLI